MATTKQIEANRRNALKSTGPKTPEGKDAVVAVVRYSVIKFDYSRVPPTQGIDPTTLGFAPSVRRQIPASFRHLPSFTIQGMNALPGGGPIGQNEQTHQISGSGTKVSGRHARATPRVTIRAARTTSRRRSPLAIRLPRVDSDSHRSWWVPQYRRR
jgi:hypothetical protein